MRSLAPHLSFLGGDRGDPTKSLLSFPRVGIYMGEGASHSWLWFIDMLEHYGFQEPIFLDEKDIKNGLLTYIHILAISGGDTFAIARALGEEGAQSIIEFVKRGGIYIGSCAGAYLPLFSSKNPLHLFNFVKVKIANITKNLPLQIYPSNKFCTSYGCSYIFHPVRDEVEIRATSSLSSSKIEVFPAPIYGGPIMIPGGDAETIAYYEDFTEKTLFLIPESIAQETMIGKAAIVRKEVGNGIFYLFGPHLEHPYYEYGRSIVVEIICKEFWKRRPKIASYGNYYRRTLSNRQKIEFVRFLKRHLSNARIIALALEGMAINWKIGNKFYEPEKIRVFLEALWKRLCVLERREKIVSIKEAEDILYSKLPNIRNLLRKLKKGASHETAALLFSNLKEISRAFFRIYFAEDLLNFQDIDAFLETKVKSAVI